MFGPLLRSRPSHQYVRIANIAATHRHSIPLHLSVRYKSLGTVAEAGSSVEEDSEEKVDGINSSIPEGGKQEKKKGSKPKNKVHGKVLSKSAPCSDEKTPAALLVPLSIQEQAIRSKVSYIKRQQVENVGGSKENASGTSAGAVENSNGDKINPSHTQKPKTGKKHFRKRRGGKTPLIRTIPSRSKLAAVDTGRSNNFDPKVGSASNIGRRSQKVVKNAEKTGKKELDGQDQSGAPSIQYIVCKDEPNSRTVSPLKSSKKPKRGSLVTMPLSDAKGSSEVDALSRQALISFLRTNKLSVLDKKLIMSRLRAPSIARLTNSTEKGQPIQSEMPKGRPSKKNVRSASKEIKEKPGMTAYEIKTIEAADLQLVPLEKPQPPVPTLAYGLDRVLFNPGVYQLQDPRSRVFNFDPYLQSIMPVAEFDFNALKEYITSSRDETLISTAAAEGKKYTGSTSSMTSALAHFHFLLSQWRPVNISTLSQGFPETLRSFTALQRAPSAVFLRWKDGTYAIDADKEFDSANILMMLGKSMEKLLTLPTAEFEKYRKENSDQISKDERDEAESFHYTTMGDFLMRSQLDAYDPHVPGTGMFDLKTRAVVSIRMDAQNYHSGLGYEIKSRHGEFESYEREYYDMIRAAFLKYSLQVRMGRMDGVFVAFHNTERIFGFQYISLPEMDLALHGQENLVTGDSEFKLSLELLNRVLDRAITRFPKQSLRLFFETRETVTPFMYIFAEPVTESEIQGIQESKKAEIREYERTVLGLDRPGEPMRCEGEKLDWELLQAKVEEAIDDDELNIVDSSEDLEEDDEDDLSDEQYKSSRAPAQEENEAKVENKEELIESGNRANYSDSTDSEIVITRETNGVSFEDDPNISSEDGLPPPDDTIIEQRDSDNQGGIRAEESNGEMSDDVREQMDITGDIPQPGIKIGEEEEAETNLAQDSDDQDTAGNRNENGHIRKVKRRELLAMTLTIRNKVNGIYVERPENLGSEDCWSVEYALAEVPKQSQSRSLYEATQRRRARVLKENKDRNKSNFNRSYTQRLRQLSQNGRKWREKQDEIDQLEPAKVLMGQTLVSEEIISSE